MIPAQLENTLKAFAAWARHPLAGPGQTVHITFDDDTGLALGPSLVAPGISGSAGKILCSMVTDE